MRRRSLEPVSIQRALGPGDGEVEGEKRKGQETRGRKGAVLFSRIPASLRPLALCVFSSLKRHALARRSFRALPRGKPVPAVCLVRIDGDAHASPHDDIQAVGNFQGAR
jgi:hypothetical protein